MLTRGPRVVKATMQVKAKVEVEHWQTSRGLEIRTLNLTSTSTLTSALRRDRRG